MTTLHTSHDKDKLEYFCPFCLQWVLKKDFQQHKIFHNNDPNCNNHPEQGLELRKRFEPLGLWDER